MEKAQIIRTAEAVTGTRNPANLARPLFQKAREYSPSPLRPETYALLDDSLCALRGVVLDVVNATNAAVSETSELGRRAAELDAATQRFAWALERSSVFSSKAASAS